MKVLSGHCYFSVHIQLTETTFFVLLLTSDPHLCFGDHSRNLFVPVVYVCLSIYVYLFWFHHKQHFNWKAKSSCAFYVPAFSLDFLRRNSNLNDMLSNSTPWTFILLQLANILFGSCNLDDKTIKNVQELKQYIREKHLHKVLKIFTVSDYKNMGNLMNRRGLTEPHVIRQRLMWMLLINKVRTRFSPF